MRLLLDTHVLLWTMTDHPRLSPAARTMMTGSELFVSVVSLWEIAIKHSSRPAEMPISGADAARWLHGADASVLDVTPAHVLALETLPPLHRDPFDRMLVAQARSETLRLLTSDVRVANYGGEIERV
jgi:PIN domain nuclease of toxin-antitoxin system